MFERFKKPVTVEAGEYQDLQNRRDVKTDAELRIHRLQRQLLISEIHPWAADDRTQLILGWSSIAYMNDRIAEKVAEATVVVDKDGNERLSPVVNNFVTVMSERSYHANWYAGLLEQTDDSGNYVYADGQAAVEQDGLETAIVSTIDQETPALLTIGNHLPVMPDYPPLEPDMETGQVPSYDNPPERSLDIGTITPEFVSALIDAVDEIQAYAYTLATDLQEQTPGEIPDLYKANVTLKDFIQDNYLSNAQANIEYARECLVPPGNKKEVSPNSLAEAYEAAYNGLIFSGQAFTALHCPATFGPDWFLAH